MQLTRRSLLASLGALAAAPRARAATGGPKYLVVVIADGGWDVTFAMDPKDRGTVDGPWVDEVAANPNDREYVQTFGQIPVQCNDVKRSAVTRFFTAHGAQTCVVNGIWTGSIVHQPSRIRLLTGTTQATRADVATVVGYEKGVSVDRPLGSVDFSGLGYVGDLAATTGRIGHRSQLKALLQPGVEFRPPPGGAPYPLYDPTETDEDLIRAHLAARVEQYRSVYGLASDRTGQRLDDLLESWGRADRLLAEGDLLADPLTLGVQPDLLLQADVAAQLLAGGLCHAVTMAHFDSWDTHDRNATQHERYQSLFTAVDRLVVNLQVAGIYEDSLIAVVSEMTRTPKLNRKGGKDHWPHTSALLVGPSVRGGERVGGTSDVVESLTVALDTGEVDPAGELNKYDNFAAGLVEHFGVDPERWYPGVRPFRGFARS